MVRLCATFTWRMKQQKQAFSSIWIWQDESIDLARSNASRAKVCRVSAYLLISVSGRLTELKNIYASLADLSQKEGLQTLALRMRLQWEGRQYLLVAGWSLRAPAPLEMIFLTLIQRLIRFGPHWRVISTPGGAIILTVHVIRSNLSSLTEAPSPTQYESGDEVAKSHDYHAIYLHKTWPL